MSEAQKVALIILDGFALGDPDPNVNAYQRAKAPLLNTLFSENSVSFLKTDGHTVGLPGFQVGGSEVGHLTIGSGRVTKHILTRIQDEVESGEFFRKPELQALFKRAKKTDRIHLLGLASDGGIHSFLPHCLALQKMAKQFDIQNVFVHALVDGRDVPVRTAKDYLKTIDDFGYGEVASLGGRFYAMDRDLNWERTEEHYRTFLDPEVSAVDQSWEDIIDTHYQDTDQSDYYVPPFLLNKDGQIREDDIVICFNFRTDRMKQITAAFCDEHFSEFERPFRCDPNNFGVFGHYYDDAHTIYSLTGTALKNTLGEVVANNGKKQIRVAETEKKKHVTFFFSGEREDLFPGEERIIAQSSGVLIYSDDPEMSAAEHTDGLIARLEEKNDIDFVFQNFANPDIVGHSGSLEAATIAVETVNRELGKLLPVLKEKGFDVLITADHGNCDIMKYPDGSPHASHTKTPVPCILLKNNGKKTALRDRGTLADLAPTVLTLMELEIPEEMTGKCLFD